MTTSTAPIPILRFSDDLSREDLSDQMRKAMMSYGFVYITHPSLDRGLIESMFEISKTFFRNTTETEKSQCARQTNNMGYVAFKSEKLDSSKADRQGDTKEAFNLGRLSLDEGAHTFKKTQAIPSSLSVHLPIIYEFQNICRMICLEILTSLATSFGLSEDFFVTQHSAPEEEDLSILRLLHYPADPSNLRPDSDSIRAGAHSDYGSLTLLFQESNGPTGLQVLTSSLSGDKEHEPPQVWKDVAVVPGAILVNIGDALEFWTSGQLKSTVHRVIQPTHPDHPNPSRFSITYFCQPDPDAILKDVLGLPSPDQIIQSRVESKGIKLSESLTSREHLSRRLAATHLQQMTS